MHKWSCKLHNLNKQQLRLELISKRNLITIEERLRAADKARQIFINTPLFLKSQQIACYFAAGSELDCMPMMDAVWAAKKNCFLPVLSDQKNLLFAAYHFNDPLCMNRYNILEPQDKKILPTDQLDLVCVPLVGFDLQGNRLGMGGGYYDRTFAFLQDKKIKKPYLIGLAYESQCVSALPKETFDVTLDAVLTEETLYTFNANSR